jgi:hypothetical protein
MRLIRISNSYANPQFIWVTSPVSEQLIVEVRGNHYP